MSDKHLTELPWKTLVTKEKIKDPGLGKALGVFGNCKEDDYPGKLKALEEIDKHGASLKKEHATPVKRLPSRPPPASVGRRRIPKRSPASKRERRV